jgi:hypothetical protein
MAKRAGRLITVRIALSTKYVGLENLPSYNVTHPSFFLSNVTLLKKEDCSRPTAFFIIKEDQASSNQSQFLNFMSYHSSLDPIGD